MDSMFIMNVHIYNYSNVAIRAFVTKDSRRNN